jgi:hypothetical protein
MFYRGCGGLKKYIAEEGGGVPRAGEGPGTRALARARVWWGGL